MCISSVLPAFSCVDVLLCGSSRINSSICVLSVWLFSLRAGMLCSFFNWFLLGFFSRVVGFQSDDDQDRQRDGV